jgi:hypothetical protein
VIRFDFAYVHLDGPRPRDAIEIMLRIVATCTVTADEVELLSEPEFPIVELAAQLDYWLRKDAGMPFTYDSAEAEEALVWFKPEVQGWRIGSDWQKQPNDQLFPIEELTSAASSYIGRVKTEVKATLNIDVTPAFRLRG